MQLCWWDSNCINHNICYIYLHLVSPKRKNTKALFNGAQTWLSPTRVLGTIALIMKKTKQSTLKETLLRLKLWLFAISMAICRCRYRYVSIPNNDIKYSVYQKFDSPIKIIVAIYQYIDKLPHIKFIVFVTLNIFDLFMYGHIDMSTFQYIDKSIHISFFIDRYIEILHITLHISINFRYWCSILNLFYCVCLLWLDLTFQENLKD